MGDGELMLTRLRVSGFKNLMDVDVRFGPFTCVAGANGVGKSNLLDAITFLGALADRPLMDAALGVRDEEGRTGDLASIFHRVGDFQETKMLLEAEMIIPQEGTDDLGQEAKATRSFLRYTLELGCRAEEGRRGSLSGIEILREELTHIRNEEARKQLGFPYEQAWYRSAITGRRWTKYYISTADEGGSRVIKIHQDGGSSGKPSPLLAANLPRTAISAANAAESPTATLVKREMQSWRRLQLEPSALRKPDKFAAQTSMDADGAHLPATLYDLARKPHFAGSNGGGKRVYTLVANRLSELIDDVREVEVDRDEKRELLTLRVRGKDGTFHPARALSDGTLRFLALAVLELDPDFTGVLCLEEPENGIHPERIPAILRLLQDIATDLDCAVDADNPLRQVIVNTHSPAVVAQIPEESLMLAESVSVQQHGRTYNKLSFSCLPGTWRSKLPGAKSVPKGKLLSYLSPVPKEPEDESPDMQTPHHRVIDNPEIQMLLWGSK